MLEASVVRGLVHVLDVGLEDEQVGSAFAVDLQASLVIPFDDAFQRLSIFQHKDHGCLGLHLFHVIEIFRIGLIGRSGLLLMIIAAVPLILDLVQGRTY